VLNCFVYCFCGSLAIYWLFSVGLSGNWSSLKLLVYLGIGLLVGALKFFSGFVSDLDELVV